MAHVDELEELPKGVDEVLEAAAAVGGMGKVVEEEGPYVALAALLLMVKELPNPLIPDEITQVGGGGRGKWVVGQLG